MTLKYWPKLYLNTFFCTITVCDEPMLEGDKVAPIPGLSEPKPDGFVEAPVEEDGTVTASFPNTPSELTQVQVKRPSDVDPEDEVEVTVTYTDEDGNDDTKVRY